MLRYTKFSLESILKLVLWRDRAKSSWSRPEVKKARRRTEVRREPFLPTTQIHGLCSRSQSKEVLGLILITYLISICLSVCPLVVTSNAKAVVPVVINELMASNSNGEQDPQGQREDWIEIYNYGSHPVHIGGMYMTDDFNAPTRWQIPVATTVPAGGYLLIWADEDTADAGLHANFKLDVDGEQIGLFETDGVTEIDSVIYPEQITDVSYGRDPNANDSWRFISVPTPGARNEAGYLGIVADTKFSTDRGFYDEPLTVEITTETAGADIYYSLDGSEPYLIGPRNSIVGTPYTGPITIDKTTCLRAVAIKSGWKSTNVDTQTYIFLDDVIRQDFQTTLGAGFPTTWGSWSSPDYGMDRDVIGTFDNNGNPLGGDRYGGIYAATIRDDLKSIPTLSIVMDIDDMFGSGGIYSNPTASGVDWERPASVELIYPEKTEGFQANCGIRIQGGYFRRNDMSRKHSFRLLFKGIYGPTELRFPFFGEDAVDSFETIVLRAGANDGYAWNEARYTEQYTRDEFGRRLQLATGHAGAHGIFVHLYINGIYWGLYNPCERPDNSFSAGYYGGRRDDWDAIHEGGYPGDIEATNGDFSAWNQMLDKCRDAVNSYTAYQELQGNNPDGTTNPAYPNLLDITNYVDYLIVNIWAGNWDWPWKNYWLGRDRSQNSTGFKFYNWDFENTMGNNLARSPLNKNALNNDFDDAGRPHQSLRNNAEYRLFFADRIHRLFFNDGILTPGALYDSYSNLAAEIERAMVAESARWGDMHYYSTPLTLEDWYDDDEYYSDGRVGRGWILNYYIPQRSDIVLGQFRNAGLYPDVDAPVFHINGSYQHGGWVKDNSSFSMTANDDTIWFTLDGSDPRLPGTSGDSSLTNLVAENTPKRVLVPTGSVSNNWKGGSFFDDSDWISGTGGVGYEAGSGYQNYIGIDLYNRMYRTRNGCYIRIPFNMAQYPEQFDTMTLRMRYDDGFVAYINGTEVAGTNAPLSPQWNSTATAQNSDAAAVNYQDFNVSSYLNVLSPGENILTIHGLNISPDSSDFLISTELAIGKSSSVNTPGISPNASEYTGPITLTESTHIKARVLSGGTWSALNEATYAVGPVSENLRITEIMYHPQNDPNEEFVELTNIGNETINLNLVSFINGIDFTFPSLELAPGEYVVVVQDTAAFQAQYGMDITIAGQYTGRLNNAGEKNELVDAVGRTILEFSYKDGWYSTTDGDGFSLTIINPANPDPNSWDDKDSWRASAYTDGSPGWDEGAQ